MLLRSIAYQSKCVFANWCRFIVISDNSAVGSNNANSHDVRIKKPVYIGKWIIGLSKPYLNAFDACWCLSSVFINHGKLYPLANCDIGNIRLGYTNPTSLVGMKLSLLSIPRIHTKYEDPNGSYARRCIFTQSFQAQASGFLDKFLW